MLTKKQISNKINEVAESDETYGGIAQLGEHLPCTQGVKSSNLFISTKESYEFIHNFFFMFK